MSTSQPVVRLVRIEWDRGHDTFDAAVCVDGATGVIVQPFHDLVPIGGLRWIRRDEILEIDDLDESHPAVRLAAIRGFLPEVVAAGLTDLTNLLRWARERNTLFLFHQRRTGSGEGLVGPIDDLDDRSVTFVDVSPAGVTSNEMNMLLLDDVIAVEWDTPYLRALADLREHEAG